MNCEIIIRHDTNDETYVRFFLMVSNEQAGIVNFEFKDSRTLYCSRIKIHEEFRGNGYSKKLLQRMKDYARENSFGIYLDISPSGNLDVQDLKKLYESYGFQSQADGTWLLDFRKHNSPVS